MEFVKSDNWIQAANHELKNYCDAKIIGEYDKVARMTEQFEKLTIAWAIQITGDDKIEQAHKLIELICKKFNISYKTGRWKFGREDGRARGGFKYGKRKKGERKRIAYASFVDSRLSVGIILHEMAHVIQYNRWQETPGDVHGRKFCQILDNLVVWYHENVKSLDFVSNESLGETKNLNGIKWYYRLYTDNYPVEKMCASK